MSDEKVIVEVTPKYKLRTLEAGDIFPMVSLIKKFGVDNFKRIFHSQDIKQAIDENGDVNMEQLGAIVGLTIAMDVLAIVLENLERCENEVFAFLGRITELGDEEVRKIPLDDFAEIIVDFVNKKELKGFFMVVLKLLK